MIFSYTVLWSAFDKSYLERLIVSMTDRIKAKAVIRANGGNTKY